MAKKMAKAYLVCSKCHKRDVPDTKVSPHNPGTSIFMSCQDCKTDSIYATLCRDCCPTGHGTRPGQIPVKVEGGHHDSIR